MGAVVCVSADFLLRFSFPYVVYNFYCELIFSWHFIVAAVVLVVCMLVCCFFFMWRDCVLYPVEVSLQLLSQNTPEVLLV